MSKQTAVEWYAQNDTELTIQFLQGNLNQFQLAIEKIKCLEKAKAMHKEEIMEAHYAPKYGCFSEQYYQETYGGQDE